MVLESLIAALLNDLNEAKLNRTIPILSLSVSNANAVLFYKAKKPILAEMIKSPESDLFQLAGAEHASASLQQLFKPHCSMVYQALHTLKAVIIEDIFDPNIPATKTDREFGLKFSYRSLLAIPLFGKKHLHGLLIFFYTFQRQFDDEYTASLTCWSQFCSIAIEQAKFVAGHTLSKQYTDNISSDSTVDVPETGEQIDSSRLVLLGSSISHEINNSLDGIKNYIYLISSETSQEHPHKEYLKIIESEIERTGKIVRQLSDLYQHGKIIRTKFSVNNIIQSAVKLMEHQAEIQKCKLILQLDKNIPLIIGVPDQFKSVILNLILNSIQAMPSGGDINIKSELHPDEKGKIRIILTDAGIGISREHIAHIFQPFYTTKKGGTGLGLTISRQIIKSHNGSITFESLPEKGTRFIITMPIEES